MKKFLTLTALAIAFFSCTTNYKAVVYDDAYYVPGDPIPHKERQVVQKQNNNEYLEQDSTVVNPQEDEFYYDDYYDYAYSARIRRFHNNNYFGSYYNDFYTNNYWYDYNPWGFGSSIYLGYNFWGGGYYPYYSYSYSRYPGYIGYAPWSAFGPYGFYSPYSYYDYRFYNPFYSGIIYSNYYGSLPYYNSYDKNSHYYGPRTSVALGMTKDAYGVGGGGVGGTNLNTFGSKYESVYGNSRTGSMTAPAGTTNVTPGTYTNTRSSSTIPGQPNYGTPAVRNASNDPTTPVYQNERSASQNQRSVSSPVAPRGSVNSSDLSNPNINTTPNSAPRNTRTFEAPPVSSPSGTSQQAPRFNYQNVQNSRSTYSRPPESAPAKAQPYSAPSYSKPRSSQEYTTPKYRNEPAPVNTYNNSRSEGNSRSYSSPSSGYSSPSSSPSYSSPSSSSRSSSSSPSYSAPTPSYSAPSSSGSNDRSGGSSSSSGSSSSGSSGGSYSGPRR